MSTARRQLGAATVEFYVVSFFVLIPVIMGMMQMGMFMVAKNTVNLAALATARAGAASKGHKGEMATAFATALSPLYVAKGIGALNNAGFTDVSNGNYAQIMGVAYLRARTDVSMPYNSITKLNPTANSFADFGVTDRSGNRIIPTTNILNDNAVGAKSHQTRADALLLKVQVRYCYEMVFPVIDELIYKAMTINPLTQLPAILSPAELACMARKPPNNLRGIPIISQAVVRMTTPPLQSNF
ncbi:TadE/TadG family type IV pilus assembly protein [Undibacterium sp. RuTC16W]|uniref:TadE/TadG family type IV pilus assembly protein n=1 Tax=Undibacterium sp. RuTC16W TaxID=3413048 RepID=UPI003BF377A4